MKWRVSNCTFHAKRSMFWHLPSVPPLGIYGSKILGRNCHSWVEGRMLDSRTRITASVWVKRLASVQSSWIWAFYTKACVYVCLYACMCVRACDNVCVVANIDARSQRPHPSTACTRTPRAASDSSFAPASTELVCHCLSMFGEGAWERLSGCLEGHVWMRSLLGARCRSGGPTSTEQTGSWQTPQSTGRSERLPGGVEKACACVRL